MSKKEPNLQKLITTRKLSPVKKTSVTNALYSGTPKAQRSTQQQQQRSSDSRYSTHSKRRTERTLINSSGSGNLSESSNYHCWDPEYHQRVIRHKKIKPMTKDPYTPVNRLISHAVETVMTENECCLPLIPIDAVKIETIDLKIAPKRTMPKIVRYLRHNQLMPSQQTALSSTSTKFSLLSQPEYRKPISSSINTSNLNSTSTLATTNHLLNRAKMRTDTPVIRRPVRKLVINATHETIIPLSLYG